MHLFLKKYYFISKLDTKIIDNLDKETIIIYRNYNSKLFDISHIISIRNYCKKKRIKFFLSNNFRLALKLNLDGAYIPSFNNQINHLNYSIYKNFTIIGSAHNLKQIRVKEVQKVDEIFISSLFKKNNNYLGIYKYKLLTNLTKKKTIPLGGVSHKNLRQLNMLKHNCFAGISFFEKKKAPKI